MSYKIPRVNEDELAAKAKVTPKNVASYIRAKASQVLEGDVPPHVFQERKDSCMSCPFRVADKADEIGFCGKCGCGRGDGARLTNKLKMPKVACPEGRWQESKGQRK